jgi:hypothetical protein
MKKSKLYYYLSKLNEAEKKELEDFLSSPIFNKDSRLLPLFRTLQQELFEKEGEISREKFFSKLNPGKDYDANQLRVLMSRLLDQLFSFLSYKEWEGDDRLRAGQMLSAANKRKMDKYFSQLHQKASEELQASGFQDSVYFYHQMKLEVQRYQFQARQPRRSTDFQVSNIIQNLDNYYLISKLGFACASANLQMILPSKEEIEGLEILLDSLRSRNEAELPLAGLLLKVYRMLTEPEKEEIYYELRNALIEEEEAFPANVSLGLYTYALNYCNRRVKAGAFKFQGEAALLYNLMLDREIIMHNGQLPAAFYKNIVNLFARIGAKTNDFHWVDKFIVEYKEKVAVADPEAYFQFCRSILLFYKGEYLKAATTLNEVWRGFQDEFFRLDARVYFLMSIYELEEDVDWERIREERGFNSLDKEMAALRVYILRNEIISEAHKENYSAFIRLFKAFLTALGKEQGKLTGKLEQINSKLEQERIIPQKAWLQEKIALLLED